MELCHKNSILENPAMQRLGQFVCEHRKQWDGGVPDLEQYERELHKCMMAVECELLGEELARYDVSIEQIEVEGETYRPALTSTETYLSGRERSRSCVIYTVQPGAGARAFARWNCVLE